MLMNRHWKQTLLAMINALGGILAVGMIAIFVLVITGPDHPASTIAWAAALSFLPTFVIIIGTIHWLLHIHGKTWRHLGFTPLSLGQWGKLAWQVPLLWGGVIGGQGLFLLLFFLPFEDSLPQGESTSALLAVNGPTIVLTFVILAILTPLLEEILFRGYLQRSVQKYLDPFLAVGISALLFTLCHAFTLIIMPAIFILGLGTGYLYHTYQSIYAPLSLHMFLNSINVFAVGFVF